MGARPRHCLACGSSDTEYWAHAWDAEYRTSDDRYQFHRCGGCGVLFIDPVPRDRLREIYPPSYYAFEAPRGGLINRVKNWLDRRLMGEILEGLPGEELAVLDIGGGAGWQMNGLSEMDPRVRFTQVVDIDPEAEERARRNGHDYFPGTIEEFEVNRRFDLVLMLNLIEHVEDPHAVLAKVASLLSPGGRALVKTPNFESWDARVFRHANWGGYHCPRHWVLFERNNFTALAERAGLGVKSFSYTQGAPFWAISVISWLAEHGILRVTREHSAQSHPLFPVLSAGFAAMDFARGAAGARTSQMFFHLGLQ
ncbi:class I SAM-dependent methyltransferase [Myxococcota bacterium]|nr:class I SAM-dependent methyltransferase [Myxococcota bacterium]